MTTFHFVPNGKNRTHDLVEALRIAPDGALLCFDPGQYDFYADGAHEDYFSPSCNTSSDKKVVFPILRKKHLTIDGGGSLFLFHDRVFPFIIKHCDGVTLKNFTVDFSFPRYVSAEIEEANESGIRLRILDRDLPYDVNEMHNLCFSAGADTFETCEKQYFLQVPGGEHCYLVAGQHFYQVKNAPAAIFYCDAVKESDSIWLKPNEETDYLPPFSAGQRLAISYDEDRTNDVIFLDRSKNITIQDVTVHRGAGMGIVGNCCENLSAERFVIEPKPGRGDDFSTTADGILLTNFTGLIHLHDCRICNTMDDSMSIHGFYTKIERITAKNKMIVRLLHPSQSGILPYSKGDTVTFSDGETLAETHEAVIQSAYMAREPDLIYLTFTAPIHQLVKSGDWLENKSKMPRALIEGCHFEQFPALRIGNPRETVFRRNTVKNGAFVINDLMTYWAASGSVHHLTVSENTFIASGISFLSRKGNVGAMHSDITIEDNRFIDCEAPIAASNVCRLSFMRNRFEGCGEASFDESCKEITKDIKT